MAAEPLDLRHTLSTKELENLKNYQYRYAPNQCHCLIRAPSVSMRSVADAWSNPQSVLSWRNSSLSCAFVPSFESPALAQLLRPSLL